MTADPNTNLPATAAARTDIFVLCEARTEDFRPATYELLAQARGLAAAETVAPGGVTALVAGSDGLLARKLEGLAHRVIKITSPELTPFTADPWVEALAAAILAGAPRAVLFGESGRTREILPRLAARLGAWALSNCVDLKVAEGDAGAAGALTVSRPVYGGKAYVANVVPADGLLLAAFRPHSFEANSAPGGLATTTEDVAAEVAPSRVALVERAAGGPRKVDLTEAAVVVAGGRGMKGPENFGLLDDLADALEGAVGYSRALVDAGLAEHADQVGKSGKTVSPTLYFAVGVSGAIHHIMGMDTAKVVVAINTDPSAPIFEYADYGVVGDALQVLPALTGLVRAVAK